MVDENSCGNLLKKHEPLPFQDQDFWRVFTIFDQNDSDSWISIRECTSQMNVGGFGYDMSVCLSRFLQWPVFIGDAMVTTWNPQLDTWKVLAGVPGCTMYREPTKLYFSFGLSRICGVNPREKYGHPNSGWGFVNSFWPTWSQRENMQLEIHTSSYPARRVEEETVKEQQGASQLEELRWDDFYPFSQYSWFSGRSI